MVVVAPHLPDQRPRDVCGRDDGWRQELVPLVVPSIGAPLWAEPPPQRTSHVPVMRQPLVAGVRDDLGAVGKQDFVAWANLAMTCLTPACTRYDEL
jgi:hypothetical protein